MKVAGLKVLCMLLGCAVCAPAQSSRVDTALALLPDIAADTSKLKAVLAINYRLAAEGSVAAALDITDQVLAATSKAKPSKALAVFMQRMADQCVNHGNYPKALELCFVVKHLAEQLKAPLLKADAINTMGIIYWYEGEYQKALVFFEDVLKIHQQNGSDGMVAGVLNNLGLIYRQMGHFDKACNYYEQSITLARKYGREGAAANAYNNLGIVCQLQKKLSQALAYFDTSLIIRKKIGDQIGIAISYGNMGAVYMDQRKLAEAERYYRDSYALSVKLDDLEGVKETGRNLSELYEMRNMPDSALRYYKIYIAARDTLGNEVTKRDALKRDMQYKFEKEQERRTILQEAESRRQGIYLWAVCIILLLISVFAIVLMTRFRVTQKQKRIIEEKNKEILDSIHYAKRIQQSLLTSHRYIQRSLERLTRRQPLRDSDA